MSKTILYITNGISGSGGLERVVCLKASYFADVYKNDVHIITLNKDTTKLFYNLSPKISIHNLNVNGNIFKFYLNYYYQIKKTISFISPDVIFVADDGLKGILFRIIFNLKCKVIYERHTTKAIQGNGLKSKFINFLMNFGAKKFDKFVVLTNSNKNDWPNIKNLVVIPNPLPFSPQWTDDIQIRKKIISVGSISHIKGHDILIKAWHKIHTQFPNYSLHIYGEKKDNYDYIYRYIETNKLYDCVFVHNPTSDIQQKYMESAICILPSRVEGFGMVIIEAMACGAPCIVTNCEGPKDIISDNVNGFVVNKDDYNSIANKIVELLTNLNKLENMSKEAYNSSLEYKLSSIMKQWNDLID